MSKVTLEIKGQEIVFNPNIQDYNKFINEIQLNNKITPAHNYISRIVDKDSKDALIAILKTSPGAALQIATAINEEYAPDLEIAVKK